jgi:predicted Rossmann fold nucleotide-binding protein DprA/Smf involved in DNA uptake
MEFGVVNIPVQSEQEDDLLRQVGLLTEQMRDHQEAIKDLNTQRRRVVRRLRKMRVAYRRIAGAAGVSDQALYADLRKHPEVEEGNL